MFIDDFSRSLWGIVLASRCHCGFVHARRCRQYSNKQDPQETHQTRTTQIQFQVCQDEDGRDAIVSCNGIVVFGCVRVTVGPIVTACHSASDLHCHLFVVSPEGQLAFDGTDSCRRDPWMYHGMVLVELDDNFMPLHWLEYWCHAPEDIRTTVDWKLRRTTDLAYARSLCCGDNCGRR